MTYVDNGPAWWTLLLLAIGGGLIGGGLVIGAKELAGWWVGWRRQYRARHRADPIEDASEDAGEDAAWPTAAEAADALVESWSTPLGWAANGRYVHRADCPHMTTGKPITVWSEDAARNWAESTKPRLVACPRCDPFNTPEPAEVTE